MRGLKKLVRSYIQKAELNLYTDTFKLLLKYDDHYDLENVTGDVYKNCAKSIAEKCAVDDIEFNDYVEEIIGDDLQMKNVVCNKLARYNVIEIKKKKNKSPVECAVLKESETRDELNALKRKRFEIETMEAKRFCEIEDSDAVTDQTVQKKDQNENPAKKQLETSLPPQFEFAQPSLMLAPRSKFTPFFGFNGRRPYRVPCTESTRPFCQHAYPSKIF